MTVDMPHQATGILLMGGLGGRFGSALPKQFHRLAGKQVYLHTLEKFLDSRLFSDIILVVHPAWIEKVRQECTAYTHIPLKIIPGGKSRQESSYAGLLACAENTEIVVIHDAVRPFVSLRILHENIHTAFATSAVNTCIPSTDTVVYAPQGASVHGIPERNDYLHGQTPQSFAYPLILRAHKHARQCGIRESSDDCRLVCYYGHPVAIVRGDPLNIKMTTEIDLFLAEQLLSTGKLSSTFAPSSSTSLAGKLIAIAGGSGGIGRTVSALLQQAGTRVLNVSRSSKEHPVDVRCPQDVQRCFAGIAEQYGPLDGLINCIGVLRTGPFQEQPEEDILEVLDVNIRGLALCCRYAVLTPRGHIINVASSAYSIGRKHMAAYACSKAATVSFTQALAQELPDMCINVVAPQRTATALRAQHFPDEDCSTLLSTDEVAEMIVQILGSRSTGNIIEVRKKYPVMPSGTRNREEAMPEDSIQTNSPHPTQVATHHALQRMPVTTLE